MKAKPGLFFCLVRGLPRIAFNSSGILRGAATLRSSLIARPKGLPSCGRALLRIARPISSSANRRQASTYTIILPSVIPAQSLP